MDEVQNIFRKPGQCPETFHPMCNFITFAFMGLSYFGEGRLLPLRLYHKKEACLLIAGQKTGTINKQITP